MTHQPLVGRRILITGGAGGVGQAAVEVATRAGARVAATYHRTPPQGAEGVHLIRADLTSPQDVQATVEESAEVLGGLDVLIHTAGVWQAGVPGAITVDELDLVLAANLRSTILTNQAAHAIMKRNGGQIINFGSSEAVNGSPISAGYAAAKAGVQAWTRSAATAWAADKVTVNAVAPAVRTPGAERVSEFFGPGGDKLLAKFLSSSIPLGGDLGDPVLDLGPMLVFLSGPGARFLTGQLLAVDGGLVMLGS